MPDETSEKKEDFMNPIEEFMTANWLNLPGGLTATEQQKYQELKQKILPTPNEKTTDLQPSSPDGMHKVFSSVLNDVKLNIPVMLVGPAGSGKSTLLENVAKELNLKYYPVPVCADTPDSRIVGFKTAIGIYSKTPFHKAYKNGGLFSFEEIDAGNPNVLTLINSAISQDFFMFPDGKVKKNENFRLCATANTYGYGATQQYVGRNPLDAATLDRFAITHVNYDEDLEIKIGPVKEWTFFIQALRSVVYNRYNRGECPPIIVSTRAIINGGHDVKSGTNWDDVLHKFVWKGSVQPELINSIKHDAFKMCLEKYLKHERNQK